MSSKTKLGKLAVRTAAIALAAFILVSSAGAATPASGATSNNSPTPLNVDVVNTPTVTVSGTPAVTVSGTPTVNVGTMPAVTISGSPTVNLANTRATPLFVRDVDNAARQPVNFNFGVMVPGWDGSSTNSSFDNVPLGKELVIETVSFNAPLATGETGYLTVTVSSGSGTTMGPTSAIHTIPGVKLMSSGVNDWFGGIAAARMYADGGNTVSVGFA